MHWLGIHQGAVSKSRYVTEKDVAFKGCWPCHIKQDIWKPDIPFRIWITIPFSTHLRLPFYFNDNETLNEILHVNLKHVSSAPLHLLPNTAPSTSACTFSAFLPGKVHKDRADKSEVDNKAHWCNVYNVSPWRVTPGSIKGHSQPCFYYRMLFRGNLRLDRD